MNEALVARLDVLLADLKADTTARILVISGAAGHFCAGLDLNEVGRRKIRPRSLPGSRNATARPGGASRRSRIFPRW
jgi:enoyl-CoA hydratase/carnithine racemase